MVERGQVRAGSVSGSSDWSSEGRFDCRNVRHRRALLEGDLDGLPAGLVRLVERYRIVQQVGLRGDASAIAQVIEATIRDSEGAWGAVERAKRPTPCQRIFAAVSQVAVSTDTVGGGRPAEASLRAVPR